MRILYNSKDTTFKTPFGTITEGQKTTLSIHIPASCRTENVKVVFTRENGEPFADFGMPKSGEYPHYEIYTGSFEITEPGLYFYYFRIKTQNECFSLYRQGFDMTNMEEGSLWQLSVIPSDFKVPKDYMGAVMYQIFPDRFYFDEICDLSGKLEPFWLHKDTSEIPCYRPNALGKIENCDFYGGNLKGIEKKLDYLSELGVKVIYLNPIFKAYSNHRYDTADYMKIDEALGTEEDFRSLCSEAHRRGMKIILDGVFSHTGSNSRYFDINNVYGGGAYHDPESPYRKWFDFKNYPTEYTCWWGIKTLPCTNENEDSYRDFIINGEDSVIAHWIRAGADGFRLDVADELPDSFIAELRARLKSLKPDALLIGEVWEDASNKISYDVRRKYFVGGELDSVMNYPWRRAIIDYVTGKDDGTKFVETVMEIAENYPPDVLKTLMNMLSTHDTSRILSLLSPEAHPETKDARAAHKMSDDVRATAVSRLMCATLLQFILPGMPSVFYGDEIGTEGFEDPFCRSFFNWQNVEGNHLRNFFCELGRIRAKSDALTCGDITVCKAGPSAIKLERRNGDKLCRAYVNTGETIEVDVCGSTLLTQSCNIIGGKYRIEKYGFLIEES